MIAILNMKVSFFQNNDNKGLVKITYKITFILPNFGFYSDIVSNNLFYNISVTCITSFPFLFSILQGYGLHCIFMYQRLNVYMPCQYGRICGIDCNHTVPHFSNLFRDWIALLCSYLWIPVHHSFSLTSSLYGYSSQQRLKCLYFALRFD